MFFFRLLKHKLFRFFLVSVLNTAFGYGLFALFLYLGLYYPIALFISTIAGVLFNFKTIGSIVFKSNNNALIFRFFGVYGCLYIVNWVGIAILKNFSLNSYLAGGIIVFPIGLLAYFLNKKFVF